jgi:hypothetical protein
MISKLTISAGNRAIIYTWLCLSIRDDQNSAEFINSRERNAPTYDALAIGTAPLKIST